MPDRNRIVSPGPAAGGVRTAEGQVLRAPAEWVLLPPGDAGLTRRVKAAGPTWTVQEKKGRKVFSQGVWASAAIIEQIRKELAAERATPQYARRREAEGRRRQQEQEDYVQAFRQAVVDFLGFAAGWASVAERLAQAVTDHATPVGSGTVARTERIPLPQRAEAAVIAWMRHQTTGYDHMVIARVKGRRREVRRRLAGQCQALLEAYRAGRPVDAATCPLQRALSGAAARA